MVFVVCDLLVVSDELNAGIMYIGNDFGPQRKKGDPHGLQTKTKFLIFINNKQSSIISKKLEREELKSHIHTYM
jgi:hypothetical protein